MDTQVADPMQGALLGGRYRITGRVARGGMATVYTATDERLGRTVAVKVIHSAQAHDPRFVARFADEAKTIARLTHPNVVAVYDQGTHAGLPYLVMEYVRGRTLREVLASRRRLQPAEALAILEQMLAAIAAAHRAGLMHRDVKPENVLVAEAPSGGPANLVDSVVKVADFGLARAVQASAEDPAGGQLMATVAYVAPELVTAGHADPRTDVYAAGIVLFEMLTGQVPFDGDQPVEVAWQHVDRDVPPPSRYVAGLPPALDQLVARATRRDPGARPTDAGAMLTQVQQAREDLGAVGLAGQAPSGPAAPRPEDAATTARMRPLTDATMVVASVPPAGYGPGTVYPSERPSWARLPEPGSRWRSPGGGPGPADRLRQLTYRFAGTAGTRIALVAALVAVGLAAMVGVWWLSMGRYADAPELVNMTRAQAEARATDAGFKVVIGPGVYRDDVDKDVVVAQDPGAGDRMRKGGTITLTLSLGPEQVVVPDVIGQEFAAAKALLLAKKLNPVRGPDRYDATTPAGNVLAVNPKVNTPVKPGTKVTVTVSKGRPPVTVPNVVGQNLAQAQAALQQQGLVVDVEQVDRPDRPAGEVLDQDPKPGTGVEKNTHIKLTVSKGPPQVIVPRVIGLPCSQGKQALEAIGLQVTVQGGDPAVVQFQNPPENTPVQPGTAALIACF
ncbi:MAG: Stk1 family PASTA domain-containing Ser/Thr kinase [Micromonosporaceae bacterium]|nr:Stk1 family PASTA domain-containing Ser/Thr kinase [Micromonosporaceae bacterium]